MLENLKRQIELEKYKQEEFIKNRDNLLKNLDFLEQEKKEIQEAQVIIQQAAKETQEQLQFVINDTITEVLRHILDKDYRFLIEFVPQRGKVECRFSVLDGNNNQLDPLTEMGGGVIDLISFALRLAVWSLTKKTRNTIILDEPFKHLSKDLHKKAAKLIRLLSQELGIQIIMISHSDELIEAGDKVIKITNTNGVSLVEHY
jgi:DNA repair exonuclease SbcCD ATPase subunit